MVSSYRFSNRRFIICTDDPGHLGKLTFQQLAPERGQEKGETQGQKRNLSSASKTKTKNNLNAQGRKNTQFIWVGVLAAASLLGVAGFVGMPKASAADRSWGNIEIAKRAIENVAPVINDTNIDKSAAPFVFASDEFIQKPLIAETQITKEEPKPAPAPARRVVARSVAVAKPAPVKKITAPDEIDGLTAHRFPYGYCTYYVSQKRFVPWSGNAIAWLAGAKIFGYATGSTPQAGSIMVTAEGGRVGHVAYVESVNDSSFTVSEMNYRGFGTVSSRTIPIGQSPALGFIY